MSSFPFPSEQNNNNDLVLQLLPGCYRRVDDSPSSSSSLWSEGELFSLGKNCNNRRFRFLNRANAFWTFDVHDEEDDVRGKGNYASPETKIFKAEIFESPSTYSCSDQDENRTALPSTCHIEISDCGINIRFDDDGQTFVRTGDLPSFPLATNFFTSSLGAASVSLATASLRFATELLLKAQREYFDLGASSALPHQEVYSCSPFHLTMSTLRRHFPIGSKQWKHDIKFVKQGPSFDNYCLVRVLDFIDRQKMLLEEQQQVQQQQGDADGDDEYEMRPNPASSTTAAASAVPYTITVILVAETETNVPESFQEYLKLVNSPPCDATSHQTTRKISLDSRLLDAQGEGRERREGRGRVGDEQRLHADPSCLSCDDEEELLAKVLLSSPSTASANGNSYHHHVDFDEAVPLPIRSMLFWWAELVFYLGQGNFSKTRVNLDVFDEEAMQLHVFPQQQQQELEQTHAPLQFPQFPWEKLKNKKTFGEKRDFSRYSDTDQFIIIYPRAEPESWLLDSTTCSSPLLFPSPSARVFSCSNEYSHRDQAHHRFTTSGVTLSPSSYSYSSSPSPPSSTSFSFSASNSDGAVFSEGRRPVAVIDDRSLFEPDKFPGLEFNLNLRSAYFCHWLLHETSHVWYEMKRKMNCNDERADVDDEVDNEQQPCAFDFFGHLNLETESHSWFDRQNWPTDFVSESGLEEDYFFDAIEKRFLRSNLTCDQDGGDVESCRDGCSLTRKHWPFWAKLKNRPICSTLTGKHFLGHYATADPKIDSNFVAVVSRSPRTKHSSPFLPVIEWRSRVGETPTKLFLNQVGSCSIEYSSTSSTSATSLSKADSSTLPNDREMIVAFYRMPTSSHFFLVHGDSIDSTSSSSSLWRWVASVTIGSASCVPAETFFQVDDDDQEGENDDERDTSERRGQLANKQVANTRRQNHSVLRPSRDKVQTVFERFAEENYYEQTTTLTMDASLTIAAIMNNSLLPQVDTILVRKIVREEFAAKQKRTQITGSEFSVIVDRVFEKWLEEQNDEVMDEDENSLKSFLCN